MQCAALTPAENVPAGHNVHVWSDMAETLLATLEPGRHVVALSNGRFRELMQKWDGGHGSQEPLVTLPNVPGTHTASHDVALGAVKLPHGHAEHGSRLVPALNLPAPQGWHSPSPNAACPGPHTLATGVTRQSVMVVLPLPAVKAARSDVASKHDLHEMRPP